MHIRIQTKLYSVAITNVSRTFSATQLDTRLRALRLLRTNSSKNSFEENIKAFRSRLHVRGYPDNLVNKVLSEVKFEERKSALLQGIRAHNRILPFVTQYHPAVTNLKKVLPSKWHLIQNHPLLSEIYKDPPIISYKRGKSLKDILVRSKL